jgi:hypothetical protein
MPIQAIMLDKGNDSVSVGETPMGKGVFAARSFPARAVIGEITGDLVTDGSRDASYAFEMDERTQLDPHEPFRFLNHRCEPNCEFDSFEDAGSNGEFAPLYLIALCDIHPGEELTIDYNWPAGHAIRCHCSAASCRGWIVSLDELHLLRKKRTRIR